MNNVSTDVMSDIDKDDDDIDKYESLIPRKYYQMDDQKFEKFNKRNDWN
jgi:hypothetical protein